MNTQQLLNFIQASPTPFHAVKNMSDQLIEAGFQTLNESDHWQLEPGKSYLVTRNESSLIAFSYTDGPLHILGAHTDSPCLKVKPNPVITQSGYQQLGVEVYGGVLLNPWFDRDLSIAGRVQFLDQNDQLRSALVDFKKPIAIIPSLAIHLDREANKKRSINAQTDITPIIGLETDFETALLEQLASPKKILDYGLSLYDTQAPAITGLNNEFIASARLDNLLSCFVIMKSLIDSQCDRLNMIVCNDHEEVGSTSAIGADGPFLESVLQRIYPTPETYAQAIDQGMLISCDNAHGIHPNYPDKHDAKHGPVLNQGPVIKVNQNQRYATTDETAALFRKHCEAIDIPLQTFVVRNDMACGSTIGPITAAKLGIKALDIGVPTFAMHSIRELAGSLDADYLYRALCRINV